MVLTVLNSVDTPVRDLDDLIQGNEGGLKRGQLHQQFDGALEVFLQLRKLLATSGEPRKLIRV